MKTAITVVVAVLIAVLAGATISRAVQMASQSSQPETAHHTIGESTVVASGLEIPSAVASLPHGSMLITERPGRIRHYDAAEGLREEPLLTLPHVEHRGEG